MFELRISFENLADLKVFVDRNSGDMTGAIAGQTRRTRAKKDENVSGGGAPFPPFPPTTPPTEPAKEAGMNAAQIPQQQTPSVESLFGGAPQPEALKPAAKPTQKDLIVAFRALSVIGGTDPIVATLGALNAKSVAVIPETSWADAIAAARKAANVDDAKWAATVEEVKRAK